MLATTSFFLTLFAVAIAQTQRCNTTNYYQNYCCSTTLCPTGAPHVSCQPNTFAPACGTDPFVYEFLMNEFLRTYIVAKINNIRNEAAGGLAIGADGPLPKAVRAGYASWNCSLAYHARLQAMQCNGQKDACHNTPEHPRSGQMVYRECGGPGSNNATMTVDNAFDIWTEGREYINSFDIANFTSHDDIDDYALLITDRMTAFGCALTMYEYGKVNCSEMVCNYNVDNRESCPVYTTGNVSRIDCTGFSGSQNYLCDVGECYTDPETCQDKDFCPNRAALLCPAGKTHIACTTAAVNSTYVVSLTSTQQTRFLTRINNYRNLVASGSATNGNSIRLPAGLKIAQASWSDDLAELAEIHAATCSANKDECRNSRSFNNTGQTVFVATNITDVTNIINIILLAVDYWYNTKAAITPEIILNYTSSSSYEPFAIMVQERMVRLGCGVAIKGSNIACVTCNYAASPEPGCVVYNNASTPASGCPVGVSGLYPNLCNRTAYVSNSAPYTFDTSTCWN